MEEDEVDFGGDCAEEMAADADERKTIHPPTPTTVAGGSSETAGTNYDDVTANTQVENGPGPVEPAPKKKIKTVREVVEQIALTNFSNTVPVSDLTGNIEAHAFLKTSTLIKWDLVAQLRRAKLFVPDGDPDTGEYLSAEQA